MKLGWSHTVLNIKDKEKILDFYINTLGFKVSDSGPIFENGPEIIFISYDPDEHHQLAFVLGREDIGTATALNNISFRVETYSELKEFKRNLMLSIMNTCLYVMEMRYPFISMILKIMGWRYF